MKKVVILTLLAALAQTGCASVVPHFDVPDSPDSGLPTARSITDEITCELEKMLANPDLNVYLRAGDMVAAFQLSLQVTDSGGLAPSVIYTNGLFSFGAGAVLSQSREQNFTEMLYYSMRQLYDDDKDAIQSGDIPACKHVLDTNLSGDLGLRQTVALAIQSTHKKEDQSLSGVSGEFGGYVNFVVTKNLNTVGPTWTLKHFKGPGGLFGAGEVNNDKVQFAFARSAPSPAKTAVAKASPTAKYQTVINQMQNITLNQIAGQLVILNNITR